MLFLSLIQKLLVTGSAAIGNRRYPHVKLISAVDVTDNHLYKKMQDPSNRGPMWISNNYIYDFAHDMAKERAEVKMISERFKEVLPAQSRSHDQPIVPYYKEQLSQVNKSTAVIVRLSQLCDLKRLFPQLTVHRYEMRNDFWAFRNWGTKSETIESRRHYDQYLLLGDDSELWECQDPVTLSNPCEVDCIISSLGRPATALTGLLAARMWKGFEGQPGRWETPGVRGDRRIRNPTFVLTDYQTEPHRFPPQQRTTAKQLERVGQSAEYYQQLGEYLQKHAGGCGWFTGSFQFQYLAFQDPGDGPNLLVRPGTEHEHVLPMSNEQLLQRIDSGDVASGKVVIFDSKGNNFAHFRDGLEATTYRSDPTLSYDEMLSQLFCRPETEEVVFYCNHASSSSPDAAEWHFKWLKKHHPERRQKVYVLIGGMFGMLLYLKEIGKAEQYLVSNQPRPL